MSDLSPRGRALVEAARTASPSADDRARVRAALAARLGAATLPATPPRPAPTAPAAATGGGLAKAILIGTLLGGAVVGVGSLFGSERAPAPLPVTSAPIMMTTALDPAPPSPALRATEAVPAPVVPSPAASVSPAPPVSAPRHEHAPAASIATPSPPPTETFNMPAAPASHAGSGATAAVPPENSLNDETRTLREAQMAMQSGDSAGALARLDDLGKRHPEGILRQERLVAHILALCAAGREGEARREADRFLAEVPGSIQAGRVRASCAFTGDHGSR